MTTHALPPPVVFVMGRPAPLPTLAELRRHMAEFGPEGIVESATHLPDDEREQLEAEVRKARKAFRYPTRRIGKGR